MSEKGRWSKEVITIIARSEHGGPADPAADSERKSDY